VAAEILHPCLLPPPLNHVREWLQALWQWLSVPHRRGDWPVLARSGWPVLPAAGGRLVPLEPSPELCSAVLPGADWPAGLGDLLQRLGVSVLDTAAYELPTEALLAAGYVRSGCGGGIALALHGVLGRGDGGVGGGGGRSGGARRLDVGPVEELPSAERRLLRSYLAQPIWFQQRASGRASAGLGPEGVAVAAAAEGATLAAVLRQLPVFELANNGSFGTEAAATAGGADSDSNSDEGNGGGGGAALGDVPTAIFVPLQEGTALAPQGVLWAALDERFIDAGPPGATLAAVLATHLGVPAPSAPEVYRTCVLPRLAALEPTLRDAAVAALLRALPALEAADAGFVQGLRQVRGFPVSGALQSWHLAIIGSRGSSASVVVDFGSMSSACKAARPGPASNLGDAGRPPPQSTSHPAATLPPARCPSSPTVPASCARPLTSMTLASPSSLPCWTRMRPSLQPSSRATARRWRRCSGWGFGRPQVEGVGRGGLV
jgi:hypothetical protein